MAIPPLHPTTHPKNWVGLFPFRGSAALHMTLQAITLFNFGLTVSSFDKMLHILLQHVLQQIAGLAGEGNSRLQVAMMVLKSFMAKLIKRETSPQEAWWS